MHTSGLRDAFSLQRQITIGRLSLDIGTIEHRLVSERSQGPAPAYVLAVPLTAPLFYSQDGHSGTMEAGEYVLLNQKDRYELSTTSRANVVADVLMVCIPAAELRGRLASLDDHVSRRFGANAQMTRLLADLLRGVVAAFADRPPPNPEALATEIISFITLAISAEDRGATLDVRNARYLLRRRIFAFIENNLGDQTLSPRTIAAHARISLSYLYALFNDDDTTVGQFLQTKRLQRAYELLVADPKGHTTIAEIAYQVGFKNVSHFSRSFSRHFGLAPRDARLAEPGCPPAHRTDNPAPYRRSPAVSPLWHEPARAIG